MSFSDDSPYLERTNTVQLDSSFLSVLNRDEYTKFPDFIHFHARIDDESIGMFDKKWTEVYNTHPSDAINILNKVIDRITDEQAERIGKQYYSALLLVEKILEYMGEIAEEDISVDDKLLKYSKIVELSLLGICNKENFSLEKNHLNIMLSTMTETGTGTTNLLAIEPILTVVNRDKRYKEHFLDRVSEVEAINRALYDSTSRPSTEEKVVGAERVVEKLFQAIDIYRIIEVIPETKKIEFIDVCTHLKSFIAFFRLMLDPVINSSKQGKKKLKDLYLQFNNN